ncbi:hypothetical protein OUZ56_028822 [Daphnia magna]|uniref:Uncharacterized protein n=1 Tax=Daphnia magna TaxID=35525 RepID=A0ABR0B520_9CRUS|nr:hypothetical protein OUZ56_028822 [Daphnia magna]
MLHLVSCACLLGYNEEESLVSKVLTDEFVLCVPVDISLNVMIGCMQKMPNVGCVDEMKAWQNMCGDFKRKEKLWLSGRAWAWYTED